MIYCQADARDGKAGLAMAGGNKPPNRQAILRQIKRMFDDGRVITRRHQKRREEERGIFHSSLPEVFDTARIVEDPYWDDDYDNWHVVIEGDTLDDDDPVRVVLGVDLEREFIFLVSSFTK